MGLFEDANRLAVQFACGVPLWYAQATYTGAPATVGAGVAMGGSPAYLVAVDLRPDGVTARRLRITIETLDDTADYTVELGGTGVTYTATSGDTETDILDGLAALIVADGTLNALVTATVATVASVPTLTLTGRAEADYALTDLAATGTGEIACVADPTDASFRVWAKFVPGQTAAAASAAASAGWRMQNGASGDIDYRGLADQPLSGGCDRIYVELYDVTGASDAAGAGGTITYRAAVYLGPAQTGG